MLSKALLLIFLLVTFSAHSQSDELAALLSKWSKLEKSDKSPDTATVGLLNVISSKYFQTAPNKALFYGKKALDMARSISDHIGESKALAGISRAYHIKGAYDLSLNASQQSYAISSKYNDKAGKSNALNGIGLIYLAQDDMASALEKFQAASVINKSLNYKNQLAANYINIGICYDELKRRIRQGVLGVQDDQVPGTCMNRL